ncbi:hypothetical protein Tco_1424086 [Tanacetum coccineum]
MRDNFLLKNDSSVRDGSVQSSFDTTNTSTYSENGMYQEGYHTITHFNDQNWSKGNKQDSVSSSTHFRNDLNDVQTPVSRRYSRQSKLLAKLKDYVLNSNVRYGIEKYVSYSNLKGANLCFATILNKYVEPTCLGDALYDPNWVEAINNKIEALNRNKTWTECDLPVGRKLIGSK